MRLVINNVSDAESPLEYSPWVLVSFSDRRGNYDKDFELKSGLEAPARGRHPFFKGGGIRQKIKGATAFLLDYFEHGQCTWSLRGEGVQTRWDTSRGAGIILGNYKDLKHLSHDERRQDARDMLHRFTDWCNGNIYEYVFVPEHVCSQCSHTKLDWHDADWNGAWYDTEDMFEHIQTEMKREEYEVNKISGGAAWLASYHELEGIKI